jgi:hypothetical protein
MLLIEMTVIVQITPRQFRQVAITSESFAGHWTQ